MFQVRKNTCFDLADSPSQASRHLFRTDNILRLNEPYIGTLINYPGTAELTAFTECSTRNYLTAPVIFKRGQFMVNNVLQGGLINLHLVASFSSKNIPKIL
jgi:hypothetical protein